jgi:hypothetical protein
MTTFDKNPGALLDYKVDWASWLATGETITTSEWEVPAGLTLSASSKTDTTATAWIEGGTANKAYRVTNTISTSGSRVDSRSFQLWVAER